MCFSGNINNFIKKIFDFSKFKFLTHDVIVAVVAHYFSRTFEIKDKIN